MITKLVAKYYDLLRKENKICSRKDYWTFAFITFFINVILIFIYAILRAFEIPIIFHIPLFLISFIFSIIQIILEAKRFQDIGCNGSFIIIANIACLILWFIADDNIKRGVLLGIIAISIITFIGLVSPSVKYNNKYISKEKLTTEKDKEENEKLEAFISLLENQNTKEK